MKLAELKSILHSTRENTQLAILYDHETNMDIDNDTIDGIVTNHGEKEVIRIEAYENNLIITI